MRTAPARRALWLAVSLCPPLLVALAGTPARGVLIPTSAAASVSAPAVSQPAPADAASPATHEVAGPSAQAPHAPASDGPQRAGTRPTVAVTPAATPSAVSRDNTMRLAALGLVGLLAHACGVVVFAARAAAGIWRGGRVLANATPVEDPTALDALEEIARRLGVTQRVRLLASDLAPTPFCAGVRRPAIVLPTALLEDAGRVRMVVAHELAHIRDHDHVWTVAAAFVRVFFYCHPGFHLAWRGYRHASEETCDAAAVEATGSRQAYVACLADIARSSLGAYPLGFAEPRGSLARRVHRILHGKGEVPMLRRRSMFAGGVVTAIAVITLSGIRLVSPAVADAEGVTAAPASAAPAPDAEKWETRLGNLYAIHGALEAFRADAGEYPEWLSDLHPAYLPDASQLVDPFDPAGAGGPDPAGTHQLTDPNLPVSYRYELAGPSRDQAVARLADHDGRAPLVRTPFQRNFGEVILSADGRVYLSSGNWSALTLAISEEQTPGDTGMLIAMGLRDPPEGFSAPARLTADVEAMVERFAAEAGESSGRYHAEAILRAWSHDRDGAARAIAKATSRAPDDIQVLYHYARLMHQMGRHADAIPLYERVVATNRHEMRQWEETHRDLMSLYAEAGAADKTRDLMRGFVEYLIPDVLKTRVDDPDNARAVRDAVRDALRRIGHDAEADR